MTMLCDLRGGTEWCSRPAGHAGLCDRHPADDLMQITDPDQMPYLKRGTELLVTTLGGRGIAHGLIFDVEAEGGVYDWHVDILSPPSEDGFKRGYRLVRDAFDDVRVYAVLAPVADVAGLGAAVETLGQQLAKPWLTVIYRSLRWLTPSRDRHSR